MVSNPGYKRADSPTFYSEKFYLIIILCDDKGLSFLDESYKFIELYIDGDDVTMTYRNYKNLNDIQDKAEHFTLSDPSLFEKIDVVIKDNI